MCHWLTNFPENHNSSITVEGRFGKSLHFWKPAPKRGFVVSLYAIYGGGAWESNPPTVLFARHAGFEALRYCMDMGCDLCECVDPWPRYDPPGPSMEPILTGSNP
jgi:hypothetical protein